MSTPKQFLRLPDVKKIVGFGKTTIYAKMKAGTFPEPIQIGPRMVAWDEEDIAAWQRKLQIGVKKSLS
jgi:prophage regulatory protein